MKRLNCPLESVYACEDVRCTSSFLWLGQYSHQSMSSFCSPRNRSYVALDFIACFTDTFVAVHMDGRMVTARETKHELDMYTDEQTAL